MKTVAWLVGMIDDGIVDSIHTKLFLDDSNGNEAVGKHLGATIQRFMSNASTSAIETIMESGWGPTGRKGQFLFSRPLNDDDDIDVGSVCLLPEVTIVVDFCGDTDQIDEVRVKALASDGEQSFLDMLSENVSNFDSYSDNDKDSCLDDGFEFYGGKMSCVSICQVEVAK